MTSTSLLYESRCGGQGRGKRLQKLTVSRRVGVQRKDPVLVFRTPASPGGYIDSILIPTWNPFETTNENIGPLQFHPDGQTVSRLSPSWTCLVVLNFQKRPKTGPKSLKTSVFFTLKLHNKTRKGPFYQYVAVTIKSRYQWTWVEGSPPTNARPTALVMSYRRSWTSVTSCALERVFSARQAFCGVFPVSYFIHVVVVGHPPPSPPPLFLLLLH